MFLTHLRRERAAGALNSVGLGERLGHPPSEMSGEPTGNLDESTRDEIMDVLERVWKGHGLTFVMVTHDSALAKKAPRLVTIRKGRVTVEENAGA